MTTINYHSGDKIDKHIEGISSPKARIRNIYKISTIGWPSNLFYREEPPQHGGRQRSRFLKVKDFYVDKENRIFAGYSKIDSEDQGYQFTQYAAIGRLLVVGPSAE
jgi:hypothetical protein